MNRIILALVILSVTLTGCSLLKGEQVAGAAFASQPDIIGYLGWRSSIRQPDPIAELRAVKQWADDNLQRRPDSVIDYPKLASVTWTDRSGDCDDWSYLFLDVMASHDHAGSRLMSIDNFHTVCVVPDGHGLFYHASNWAEVRGPFATTDEIALSIKPDWKRITFRNRDLDVTAEIER